MTAREDRRFGLMLRTLTTALEQAFATNDGGASPLPVTNAVSALVHFVHESSPAAAPVHARAPEVGALACSTRVVATEDTAAVMGHPDPTMSVLAGPQLALWFELSTNDLMPDPGAELSHVGVGVLVHHLERAVLGETVMLEARVVGVVGRMVMFTCEARVDQRVVALGVHQRAILDIGS